MEATPLPAVPKLTSRTIEALAAEPNSSEYALDLHNRGLKAIVELAAATRLRSLDVSFNRLVALENLEGAKELRELRAYSNRIARADDCAALAKLEVLLLSDNALRAVPPTFARLRHLRVLALDRNRLAGGLEHLGACAALGRLSLAHNELASLEGLRALPHLEELSLAGNRLAGGAQGIARPIGDVWRGHLFVEALPGLSPLPAAEGGVGDVRLALPGGVARRHPPTSTIRGGPGERTTRYEETPCRPLNRRSARRQPTS